MNGKQYDDVVVGSGISGLTVAVLLAKLGHRVLLLEKSAHIGGSLTRFSRNGVPFDTGFHFTGCLDKGDILDKMFSVVGIRDNIELLPIAENRVVFAGNVDKYSQPIGIDNLVRELKREFPREHAAIEDYFAMFKMVCDQSAICRLDEFVLRPNYLEEDFISLQQVLDKLTDNEQLKSILAISCICYGTKPSEISFANHCRMSYSLSDSMVGIKGSGKTIISGLKKKLDKLSVDVRCNCIIKSFGNINEKRVTDLLLKTGERVYFKNCVLAIHPKNIVELLPKDCMRKAFRERINSFEPSFGFFSLYAIVDATGNSLEGLKITSILSGDNRLDNIIDSKNSNSDVLVVIERMEECKDGKKCHVINALLLAFVKDIKPNIAKRGTEYLQYKELCKEMIVERILSVYPEYKDKLQVVDCASMLTFRDYLNSPDGSAYGIKQEIGQFNVIGRLPLINFQAIGQSSLLPGIIGAMLSAFIITKNIAGEKMYQTLISGVN